MRAQVCVVGHSQFEVTAADREGEGGPDGGKVIS